MQRLILSVAATVVAGSSFAASVTWQPSYAGAVSMATKSHKLVMVDFYTDWCGWCKKLDIDTYDTSLIATKALNFVPVKVNAEKEGVAQAKKYNVTVFPTILFLKPTGEVAWKITGYMPAAAFGEQMDLAKGVTTEFPTLQKQYKANTHDQTVDSRLIQYYSGLNDLDGVQKALASLEKCLLKPNSATLGSGFNAAGDALQNGGKTLEALSAYKKAVELGTPDQVVYGRISLAQCQLSVGQNEEASAVLKQLIAMGPEADIYRKIAQEMLDSIKKS